MSQIYGHKSIAAQSCRSSPSVDQGTQTSEQSHLDGAHLCSQFHPPVQHPETENCEYAKRNHKITSLSPKSHTIAITPLNWMQVSFSVHSNKYLIPLNCGS
jgi:hypothetical protein